MKTQVSKPAERIIAGGILLFVALAYVTLVVLGPCSVVPKRPSGPVDIRHEGDFHLPSWRTNDLPQSDRLA